jgi:hypothetical protein
LQVNDWLTQSFPILQMRRVEFGHSGYTFANVHESFASQLSISAHGRLVHSECLKILSFIVVKKFRII